MHRLSALVLPFFVACAPAAQTSAGTSTAAPAAQTSTAAPAAGIIGDYTVMVAETDLPADVPQQARSTLAGTWIIAFHEGNHFVVTHNSTEALQGPYQVSGNQLTFSTGESGPRACNTPATYTWQVSNGQMTFTPVGQDACRGRRVVLTSRAFTRQP